MKGCPTNCRPWLVVLLLLTVVFGLSASIEPWFQGWAGSRTGSANILAVTLGDSRRLFASHIYTKADAYFHNGYYPSMFDDTHPSEGNRLSERIGLEAATGEHCDGLHLGQARDWIDRFSRHFYPSRHVHIGEDLSGSDHGHVHGPDCNHDHDHEETHHDHHDTGLSDDPGAPPEHADAAPAAHGSGRAHGVEAGPQHGGRIARLEREILPWLRFSASLDPNKVETYVVAAYWLRTELGQPDQAEQFLREGLRANPGNPEILFELGRIYAEDRKDPARARNVWELGLEKIVQREQAKAEPNLFLYAQFLGRLGQLEETQGNWARAIEHLTRLVPVSPNRASIERWIAELKAREEGG